MRGDWQADAKASTDAPASVEEPRAETAAEAEQDGSPSQQADGADVQGDLDELVKIAAQRDEYLALAQRTQADFENYRKRVAKESRAASERGAVGLAKELLPALDNLDRALDEAGGGASGEGGQGGPLLEGVKLVRSELAAALARCGIESFNPVGETFDPSQHEAVATVPQDEQPSGTVVEVYQRGYRLGGSVIRPARVVVAA